MFFCNVGLLQLKRDLLDFIEKPKTEIGITLLNFKSKISNRIPTTASR